jgi:hypothetical protein
MTGEKKKEKAKRIPPTGKRLSALTQCNFRHAFIIALCAKKEATNLTTGNALLTYIVEN